MELANLIQILARTANLNRKLLLGTGAMFLVGGVLALLFLDPAELGARAYWGLYLLPFLGIGMMAFPFVSKNKVLRALEEHPKSVQSYQIRQQGHSLLLVLKVEKLGEIKAGLNERSIPQIKSLLPKALPWAEPMP